MSRSRRKTLSHSEIENFLSEITVGKEEMKDVTPSEETIIMQHASKNTDKFLISNKSDTQLVRDFCKLKYQQSAFGKLKASEQMCAISRQINDRTNYHLLDARAMTPELFEFPKNSLDSKKALLVSLAPMLAESETQRKKQTNACENFTRCKSAKGRGKSNFHTYTDLEKQHKISYSEYEKRYYTFIMRNKAKHPEITENEDYRNNLFKPSQGSKNQTKNPSSTRKPDTENQEPNILDTVSQAQLSLNKSIEEDAIFAYEEKIRRCFVKKRKLRTSVTTSPAAESFRGANSRRVTLSPASARQMLLDGCMDLEEERVKEDTTNNTTSLPSTGPKTRSTLLVGKKEVTPQDKVLSNGKMDKRNKTNMSSKHVTDRRRQKPMKIFVDPVESPLPCSMDVVEHPGNAKVQVESGNNCVDSTLTQRTPSTTSSSSTVTSSGENSSGTKELKLELDEMLRDIDLPDIDVTEEMETMGNETTVVSTVTARDGVIPEKEETRVYEKSQESSEENQKVKEIEKEVLVEASYHGKVEAGKCDVSMGVFSEVDSFFNDADDNDDVAVEADNETFEMLESLVEKEFQMTKTVDNSIVECQQTETELNLLPVKSTEHLNLENPENPTTINIDKPNTESLGDDMEETEVVDSPLAELLPGAMFSYSTLFDKGMKESERLTDVLPFSQTQHTAFSFNPVLEDIENTTNEDYTEEGRVVQGGEDLAMEIQVISPPRARRSMDGLEVHTTACAVITVIEYVTSGNHPYQEQGEDVVVEVTETENETKNHIGMKNDQEMTPGRSLDQVALSSSLTPLADQDQGSAKKSRYSFGERRVSFPPASPVVEKVVQEVLAKSAKKSCEGAPMDVAGALKRAEERYHSRMAEAQWKYLWELSSIDAAHTVLVKEQKRKHSMQ